MNTLVTAMADSDLVSAASVVAKDHTLVLICADGLPEVQHYDTEAEAKAMGREQIDTGDGEFKIVRFHVEPTATFVRRTA